MLTDVRSAKPEESLPERLRKHYEVHVPARVAADMDGRLDAAISSAVTRRTCADRLAQRRRPRRRVIAALAIAAVLAGAAATPVIQFFDGWGETFDRIFALSTPIDQSVVDNGYRVTLVRAYADPSSLRLAIVGEDLQDRGWAEIAIGDPTVTDDEGRSFPMTQGQYDAPTSASSESWSRFIVPPGATNPAIRHLTVAIGRLAVRSDPVPTLPNGEVDLDHVWTSIAGSWSFDFDLEFFPAHTAYPEVAATVGEVTVTWDELTVTPAATVGRLTFTGLPEVEWGWDPYFRVQHDGQAIDLEILDPGSVRDSLAFEAVPGSDDLSGTWVITIDEFHRDIPDPSSDVTTQEESVIGPWVLTFEGPPADAP